MPKSWHRARKISTVITNRAFFRLCPVKQFKKSDPVQQLIIYIIYNVYVYDKYIFNMFIYIFIYIFDTTTTSHIDVVSFIGALVVVTGYDPIHPNNLSIPALTA